MAKSILDYIVDRKRLKKPLIIFISIIGITIILCILIPIAIEKQPILLLFGVASFSIAMVFSIAIEAVFAIFRHKYIKKYHPTLWEKTRDRSASRNDTHEVLKQIHTLKDPVFIRLSKTGTIYSFIPLIIWLFIALIVAIYLFLS